MTRAIPPVSDSSLSCLPTIQIQPGQPPPLLRDCGRRAYPAGGPALKPQRASILLDKQSYRFIAIKSMAAGYPEIYDFIRRVQFLCDVFHFFMTSYFLFAFLVRAKAPSATLLQEKAKISIQNIVFIVQFSPQGAPDREIPRHTMIFRRKA